MESLVAEDSKFIFSIDQLLEKQVGLTLLPFPKMDKCKAPVCNWYLSGTCEFDDRCPHRHMNDRSNTVCKHYLNGLCKKGDSCEFLHMYDMSKMPDCYFFTKYGECQNESCPYTHQKVEVPACPWYDRGFCINGPHCKLLHEFKIACRNYINGFCPDGSQCKFAHPKWWPLPSENRDTHRQMWICRFCNEPGHKIQFCRKLSSEDRDRIRFQLEMKNSGASFGLPKADLGDQFGGPRKRGPLKPLSEITCYKCGEKGHYANNCKRTSFNFLKSQD